MDWWVAPKEHELQSDLGCYFNGLARLIDWVAINYDLLLPHKPTGECDGANIEQETCYNTLLEITDATHQDCVPSNYRREGILYSIQLKK